MKKKHVSCTRLLRSRSEMVYNGDGFRWASLLRRGEEVAFFSEEICVRSCVILSLIARGDLSVFCGARFLLMVSEHLNRAS